MNDTSSNQTSLPASLNMASSDDLSSLAECNERRRWLEELLAFRVELDELITRHNSQIVKCPLDELDSCIDAALADLAPFVGADFCRLLYLHDDGNLRHKRSPWPRTCPDGGQPTRALQSEEGLAWLVHQLHSGEVLFFADTAALPPEGRAHQDDLRAEGIRTELVIPLVSPLRVVGAVQLLFREDGRRWTDDKIRALKLVGNMVAAAVEREVLMRSLNERQEQLAAVSRLAVLGEMVAGIAHEIKQPLHAIRNFADAGVHAAQVADPPADNEQLRHWFGRITELVDRTGAIIQRFRDFCRPSAMMIRQVSVADVIADALEIMAGELRTRGVVVRKREFKIPDLLADRVQLVQVLVNLIKNACDAMATLPSNQRQIEINGGQTREPCRVWLSVRDHGPGVPESDRERIFDPFYTTKSEGTGIGLPVCRTIMSEHGGTIVVENGQPGATFKIELPCVEES